MWHGKNNLAGEIGHIIAEEDGLECECGKKGCVEGYASGFAVGKNARNYFRSHPKTKNTINDLVDGDIDKIVIGGGITHEKERFFKPLQKYIDTYAMFKEPYHIPIVRAKDKDDAGLKGCIAVAKKN